MPINPNYEYMNAEARYLSAKTDEEKILALEEMLRTMPQHKSAEALRKNIKTRHKKLKQEIEKKKKAKKSGKKSGIKKSEMQAVLIGLTNSGKSSIIESLTNAKPEIVSYPYTTKSPIIGTLDYENIKIQVIDLPAIESEYIEQGIVNTADTLLIAITNPSQLQEINPFLKKSSEKRIIILNKSDLLSEQEKRKFSAQFQSKKYNFILFSCKIKNPEEILELKKKIWQSFKKIRVYTKQPNKQVDNSPIVLAENSTVKDVAEKILHGFSERISETRITGPSSKFPNQKVSLKHILKDKDIVEFHTR